MTRLSASIGLAGFLLAQTAVAADLRDGAPASGFLATCEDLGTFCFAEACGGDQIVAAQICQARCPSAAMISIVPATCRISSARPVVVLRRRG
ncbi:hypothetical protein Q8W67_00410 [Methylobacterium sp. NEAU K]|nr:hypothetical protein [Methylobacterium sp. NEAU K]